MAVRTWSRLGDCAAPTARALSATTARAWHRVVRISNGTLLKSEAGTFRRAVTEKLLYRIPQDIAGVRPDTRCAHLCTNVATGAARRRQHRPTLHAPAPRPAERRPLARHLRRAVASRRLAASAGRRTASIGRSTAPAGRSTKPAGRSTAPTGRILASTGAWTSVAGWRAWSRAHARPALCERVSRGLGLGQLYDCNG